MTCLESVHRLYARGIDVLAGFIVGFDRDTHASFDRLRRFIMDSGIMVAMVGLLTALPKTPLYERLEREGRLDPSAASGDNTGGRTNIIPKGMTREELAAGYRRLYKELLGDRAIAERIRNKLARFGRPPSLHRERFTEAAAIVSRLLSRGILPGGLPRAWHFARSLPLARPALWHLAVNDWIAALALRDYVERHLLQPKA